MDLSVFLPAFGYIICLCTDITLVKSVVFMADEAMYRSPLVSLFYYY